MQVQGLVYPPAAPGAAYGFDTLQDDTCLQGPPDKINLNNLQVGGGGGRGDGLWEGQGAKGAAEKAAGATESSPLSPLNPKPRPPPPACIWLLTSSLIRCWGLMGKGQHGQQSRR